MGGRAEMVIANFRCMLACKTCTGRYNIRSMSQKSHAAVTLNLHIFSLMNGREEFFLLVCLRWAGPRPHIPFPSRPHFVCKFSRHGDNLSVLRPGSPSIMVLVFPDFADAYNRTTASYRLNQLSGQIPESSHFFGAS